jgi:hypothetical protein
MFLIIHMCFFPFFICFAFCFLCYFVRNSPHVYSCLFCICVQLYLPQPRVGTPIAFNIYHIVFWVCVCILAWHVKRMCHIVLADYTIYSTLSHKQRDFLEEFIEPKKCILIFSTTFFWYISHPKKNSARYDHKCTSVFMYSTVIIVIL